MAVRRGVGEPAHAVGLPGGSRGPSGPASDGERGGPDSGRRDRPAVAGARRDPDPGERRRGIVPTARAAEGAFGCGAGSGGAVDERGGRSEERGGGKEGVSTGRFRGWT